MVLSQTGDNNPLVEDILFVPILHEVLQGTYPWKNIFQDTYLHLGHFALIPVLIQILSAYFNDYNVYNIIYFGVSLSFFKLFLLYLAFTQLIKSPVRIYLFPLLSLLCFSFTTMSDFEFDLVSLHVNLQHVGMALGIWGLVRYKGKWPGLFWMAFGGILGSYSWGGGPLLWPAFLVGLLLLGYRRWTHYLVWLFSGGVAAFPYLYFIFKEHLLGAKPVFFSGFNIPFIVQAIGWPLSNLYTPFSYAYEKGIAGLVLFFLAVVLFVLKKDRKMFIQATPGWILLVYSFTQFWLQGLLRNYLQPWYTYLFMTFWFGLLNLVYVLWSNRQMSFGEKTGRKSFWSKLVFVYCGLSLLFLIGFYFHSNRDYRDKSIYMMGRSPVSATCLRHYATAPTYCEDKIFLWDLALVDQPLEKVLYSNLVQASVFPQMLHMGRPLEKSHLSVFSPSQHWTLQGDFILDQVRVNAATDVPRFFWTRNLAAEPTPFSDYEHLNLFLHSPSSVSWDLQIPQNLKKAVLHSAVAISTSAPYVSVSDGVTFEVKTVGEDGSELRLFTKHLGPNERQWDSFQISLLPFAGQKITLVFGSKSEGNNIHDWAMYRFPYIDLDLDQNFTNKNLNDFEWRPSNTDLNPLLPKPTKQDFVLDFQNDIFRKWEVSNLDVSEVENLSSQPWQLMKSSSVVYNPEKPLRFSDYSHLYFRVAAPANYYTGYLKIFIQVNHLSGYQRIVQIPLLRDGLLHEYTYDLKLLDLDPNHAVTQIEVQPNILNPLHGASWFYLPEIRWIQGGAH